MVIQFGNRLSVPLEVQRCKLVFRGDIDGRVKASALSFVMPPKVKGFAVQFPFSVLADDSRSAEVVVFEVTGIEMTFLGRVYFIPVFSSLSNLRSKVQSTCETPSPMSVYPFELPAKPMASDAELAKPCFETCATQPRLQIMFQKSGAPVESIATFSISLAEGETFTLPPLELRNFSGPTLRGQIKRLQILAIDLPGVPETLLFDTEGNWHQPDDAFFKQQAEEESSVPLRLKFLPTAISIESINLSGNVITFQIAAANNLNRLLPDGTTFRLRFRYRGMATEGSEVWRRLDITYHVACICGPRLSSMDFRPDILTASAYEEMCQSFKARRRTQVGQNPDVRIKSATHGMSQVETIFRVGLDRGMHVASGDVIFLLTVANETKSEVMLSRSNGPVGGFHNHPIETLLVHSGVSAKLPVVFPRLARMKDDGTPVDIANEIISRSNITWSTGHPDDSVEDATGRLLIPREALQEIIHENPSFVQRICQAPCDITLNVGGCNASSSPTLIALGSPLDLHSQVTIANWVPSEGAKSCHLVLEFFCFRHSETHNSQASKRFDGIVWVGKLQQSFRMNEVAMKHAARAVFTETGRFSLSVCARIAHDDAEEGVEEIWWAPIAATLLVEQFSQ
ncbi:hypothetical protein MPSEU_000852000 [Mayamaea pseudoterrestris]|nr:hypothetical protein MPSEU_000852000 [Mayamaea pseudoterrestris]